MSEKKDSETVAAQSSPGAGAREEPVASEQSANFLHPDTGPASGSQRLRLVPPDSKRRVSWWVRHREVLMLIEMILTAIFFLLALIFLWLWIFSDAPVARLSDSEWDLTPAPEWKVAAKPGRWRNIVLHHTGNNGGAAETFDRNHRELNGWENGLGYHFLIGNGKGMGDGEVHVSRRWSEQLNGAHVISDDGSCSNANSIGISLVGNFEYDVATPRQVIALRVLMSFLIDEYNIARDRIFGHGQVSKAATDCPGVFFDMEGLFQSL